MIKLLVTSTITMSEDEFFEYAKQVEERCKELPRDKFAGTLLSRNLPRWSKNHLRSD